MAQDLAGRVVKGAAAGQAAARPAGGGGVPARAMAGGGTTQDIMCGTMAVMIGRPLDGCRIG
ncbi:hypothetical protein AUP44_21875 [Tistrella mobilis]|uniref:Uncharacterized protein n=2 Tax=Tistrella mobilis TaxID=171437 RepID=A0A162LRY9_9PROT|nr:hypothetical protein AUP44_21875 [Tistrella mobilis]MAM74549.1 hypothetical protein [Tistrella sp.]